MNNRVVSRRLAVGLLLGGLLVGLAPARAAQPAVLHLQAQLIWGTDGKRPAESKVKDVEPKLREKLGRVFKWKNYFLVHEEKIDVPADAPKKVKMSNRCELEMSFVDDSTLEIKLIGEGRLTKTVRQAVKALEQGEICVLAGDDKDNRDDAWFVVLAVPKR